MYELNVLYTEREAGNKKLPTVREFFIRDGRL